MRDKLLVPYSFPRCRKYRFTNLRYTQGILCRYRAFIQYRSPRNRCEKYRHNIFKYNVEIRNRFVGSSYKNRWY